MKPIHWTSVLLFLEQKALTELLSLLHEYVIFPPHFSSENLNIERLNEWHKTIELKVCCDVEVNNFESVQLQIYMSCNIYSWILWSCASTIVRKVIRNMVSI